MSVSILEKRIFPFTSTVADSPSQSRRQGGEDRHQSNCNVAEKEARYYFSVYLAARWKASSMCREGHAAF